MGKNLPWTRDVAVDSTSNILLNARSSSLLQKNIDWRIFIRVAYSIRSLSKRLCSLYSLPLPPPHLIMQLKLNQVSLTIIVISNDIKPVSFLDDICLLSNVTQANSLTDDRSIVDDLLVTFGRQCIAENTDKK